MNVFIRAALSRNLNFTHYFPFSRSKFFLRVYIFLDGHSVISQNQRYTRQDIRLQD